VLREERAPDGRELALALREPLREAATQAAFWGAAAMLFAGLMLSVSVQHAVELALAIVLGGVTTCALSYLLVERLLRPVTARAIGIEPPEQPVGPGVRERLIMAWALASGSRCWGSSCSRSGP
jgi:adenylate cyclase